MGVSRDCENIDGVSLYKTFFEKILAIFLQCFIIDNALYRRVAQFGRALRSGRRGRKFESCRDDWLKVLKTLDF